MGGRLGMLSRVAGPSDRGAGPLRWGCDTPPPHDSRTVFQPLPPPITVEQITDV